MKIKKKKKKNAFKNNYLKSYALYLAFLVYLKSVSINKLLPLSQNLSPAKQPRVPLSQAR